jgi:hypothetical protein
MRFALNWLSILAATFVVASISPAQATTRAVVTSRDGATKLVLQDRQITFQFTEQGARSATLGLDPNRAKGDWNWMDDVLHGSSEGIKTMQIVFEIEKIRDARYENGALNLYFTSRPPDAPATDKHGIFSYENVPEDQAQAFIRQLKRLKPRS